MPHHHHHYHHHRLLLLLLLVVGVIDVTVVSIIVVAGVAVAVGGRTLRFSLAHVACPTDGQVRHTTARGAGPDRQRLPAAGADAGLVGRGAG